MKSVYIFILAFLLAFSFNYLFAKDLPGKYLFDNSKGKYGSCNHCHINGGTASAGRLNFASGEISEEEGRKIPVLKGIGKRKNQEQIERSIQFMRKIFDFKLTEKEISQLAEYIGTL